MNSAIINSIDLSNLGWIWIKNGDSCFIGKSSDYIAGIKDYLDDQEIEFTEDEIKVSKVNDCDYLDNLALEIVTNILRLNYHYCEVREALDKIDVWKMEAHQ